jgi:hypothetical protein
MHVDCGDLKEVYAVVKWLNDNISPGKIKESWHSAINGQTTWISNNGTSWRVTYYFMRSYAVEIEGLSQENETLLKLSCNIGNMI